MMKSNLKGACLKKIGEVILHQAEKEANRACPYYHNQPEMPEEVKKLGKFCTYDRFRV